jgi:hydroxypyruvate reductase
VRDYVNDVAAGRAEETPKPAHARFRSTPIAVILDRQHAVRGAVGALGAEGIAALVEDRPLAGDAGAAGALVVRRAIDASRGAAMPSCLVFSGETTVQLGSDPGRGGRCQELALAAARELDRAGDEADGIAILAAGTDGRDGPTDAAGAVVDRFTWSAVARHGIDPAVALARHDAFTALDVAGALLRTGPTGTNVNDLVLVLVP